MKGNKKFG